jgi:hypothetical protein
MFSVSYSYHVYSVVAIKALIYAFFDMLMYYYKNVCLLFFPSLLGNLAQCGTLINLCTTDWRKAKQNIKLPSYVYFTRFGMSSEKKNVLRCRLRI